MKVTTKSCAVVILVCTVGAFGVASVVAITWLRSCDRHLIEANTGHVWPNSVRDIRTEYEEGWLAIRVQFAIDNTDMQSLIGTGGFRKLIPADNMRLFGVGGDAPPLDRRDQMLIKLVYQRQDLQPSEILVDPSTGKVWMWVAISD